MNSPIASSTRPKDHGVLRRNAPSNHTPLGFLGRTRDGSPDPGSRKPLTLSNRKSRTFLTARSAVFLQNLFYRRVASVVYFSSLQILLSSALPIDGDRVQSRLIPPQYPKLIRHASRLSTLPRKRERDYGSSLVPKEILRSCTSPPREGTLSFVLKELILVRSTRYAKSPSFFL